jgi:MFS family permease
MRCRYEDQKKGVHIATQFSVRDGKRWKASFFAVWGGQALSILGSQLVQFALIWYLTVQTDSATVLATASLVGTLPQVILGPFVGTLVDRWNRRWIMPHSPPSRLEWVFCC